ncbi:helix-turn-helix domain-containing protein [Allostreptomyces psammosilenae]|uniref:Transcriptional regulator with XRE-family HTH domain n=1 Tax=Allostreptomyces psammosilenae TaxID=1892865 RepID=A0A852ZSY3_9ACTN|nr:helix-turn-helix transcriptional regulator [Allostreptomyces psammosilenae]NYI04370.1 transcriptional regulator with XRE-family HTH domain [Allostreptomyces psammosilenae]
MPAGGKPTVRSRRLGAALRRHRLAAKVDQATAAKAIDYSVTKVSRIETGQVSARVLELRALLDLYGVRDQHERERLEQLARQSNARGWWADYESVGETYADYIALESDATHIKTWETVLIPGILQVPRYVEELLASNPVVVPSSRVQEFIKVRQERQARFRDSGAHLSAIIWEPAITAPLFSAEARMAQLDHLLDIGQQPRYTIRVLPLAAGAAATVSVPFTALSFGSESVIDAVAAENITATMVIEEPHEIAAYSYAFDTLQNAALDPDSTMELIREVKNDIKG